MTARYERSEAVSKTEERIGGRANLWVTAGYLIAMTGMFAIPPILNFEPSKWYLGSCFVGMYVIDFLRWAWVTNAARRRERAVRRAAQQRAGVRDQ